ncbi:hypothetical protein K6U06_17180 [Acidiferrimicrobium sp. IK]|uniref:class F sortase n=1 Tax=Acidiferrimicrobium sp. IK TaxID=2871700 RepID=UPI0021CB614F|nr:class F sortase [Acidiferrimicrobium sp. IK]MCU4186105.1 hypothetical protein [Acidiferrimicrobium sp. IK]
MADLVQPRSDAGTAERRAAAGASSAAVALLMSVTAVIVVGLSMLVGAAPAAAAAPLPAVANPPAWGWNCPPGVTPPSAQCVYYTTSSGAVTTGATGSASTGSASTSQGGAALPRSVSAGLGPISSPPWPGSAGGLALALGIPAASGALLLRRRGALRVAQIAWAPALRPIHRWAAMGRSRPAAHRAAAVGLAAVFALSPVAAAGIGNLRFSAPADTGLVPDAALPTALASTHRPNPLSVAADARPAALRAGDRLPPAATATSSVSPTAASGIGGVTADPAAIATVGGVPPAAPAPAEAPDPGVVPVHISIPSLGVDTAIAPESVSASGALGVPLNPATVGWWSAGPRPGSGAGTAVLDSHINYGGHPGAFARLSQLAPGAIITLSGDGGLRRFIVSGTREYSKGALPWASIFSSQVQGRLALVTCGGAFDTSTGHYADNVVAFAVPLE